MSDDAFYLKHIREAIEKIFAYSKDGRGLFLQDSMIQDAIVRNFEIIGEACKRLSEDIKKARPEIPWRQISAFRNILVHDYMGVDLEEVWNVIENHLPALQNAVRDLLSS